MEKQTKQTAPTQCRLWNDPEYMKQVGMQMFDIIDTYIDEDHDREMLLQCKECSQLYHYSMHESTDWEGGNDLIYRVYTPVSPKKGSKSVTYSGYPRLQYDWPAGQESPKVWWNSGDRVESNKEFLGVWDVSDVLKNGTAEQISKLCNQLADEVNSKREQIIANNEINMIYTNKIQDAIHFSIEVHQLTGEPQFRKGKAVPYVTHPLTVGLILSQAGASEDLVVAGILHDTIEDSVVDHKVTKKMLSERFGDIVAGLVDSVTEKDRGLSWLERKEAALEEIRQFSPESLMLKSGDVISNISELISDYKRDGSVTFERFNAPKEQLIEHAQLVIQTILGAWAENPLASDLANCHKGLEEMKI